MSFPRVQRLVTVGGEGGREGANQCKRRQKVTMTNLAYGGSAEILIDQSRFRRGETSPVRNQCMLKGKALQSGSFSHWRRN